MRLLITGGAGFIGSHIQDKLIKAGHQVAIVDSLRSGKITNLHAKSQFFEVDIRHAKDLNAVFAKFQPEAVFHLAAQNEVPYSMTHPFEDLDINITGMVNLLEACKTHQVKKVIYSNTGGAYYGEANSDRLPIIEDEPVRAPSSFYGVSKAAGEQYLKLYGQAFGLPWVSLRYPNVYGPRQDGNKEAGIVAIFTQKLLNRQPPTINGNGSHTRDYIYVGDVVDANIAALNYSQNDYFNISTGIETSNNQVFQALEAQLKTGIQPHYGPARPGDVLRNSLSPAKAKKLLKWSAQTDFPKGIRLTVDYYLRP